MDRSLYLTSFSVKCEERLYMKASISLFFYKRLWDFISIISAIVIWQLIAEIIHNSFLFPSIIDIFLSLITLSKSVLLLDIAISLVHFSVGLCLSICIAIPLGVVIGWYRRAERLIDPIIGIIRPIPPIAWIPIAIIWFHLTHFAAGFVVFIGSVFPILINTYSGIRGIEKVLVDTAKTLGCLKDYHLIRSVAFPSAIPSIISGIRIGMGVGWMSVVAAEMFGVSSNGLGYRLFQQFYFLHQMDNLFAYMFILGLIALLIDRTFRFFIEKKLYKWKVSI